MCYLDTRAEIVVFGPNEYVYIVSPQSCARKTDPCARFIVL